MTTLERLQELLVNDYQLDIATLTPETPFETLGIDSLGMAELLFNVEDEFGIKLPSEPVALQTIGDAVRYIDELADQQHQAVANDSADSPEPVHVPTPTA